MIYQGFFIVYAGVGYLAYGEPQIRPEAGSKKSAEAMSDEYIENKNRGLLNPETIRNYGRLAVGDSFDPEGSGFGRHSRGEFEYLRELGTPEERHYLDLGLRDEFTRAMSKAISSSPREAVQKLVRALPLWSNEKSTKSADYLFGKPHIGSWELAVNSLGLLFLLKAREVSPEANEASHHIVSSYLKKLNNRTKTSEASSESNAGREFLKKALGEVGQADILRKIEEASEQSQNRHSMGVIASPPIIYAYQYRNLILKEILQGFPMTDEERKRVEKSLEENEAELTQMLMLFKRGETSTDDLSAFNTYALVTTVMTAKDPSHALQVVKDHGRFEFARYYIHSDFEATPRAGAARTVPHRLAELTHATGKKERAGIVKKLAKAADNYMTYLPDLMFHSRGRYMHSGSDMLAPYYFHPTVPFEAAALRILANDPSFSKVEKLEFNKKRAELASALLSSQKRDGTFTLPDTNGDEKGEGGYYSSGAWVNPLTGLALLSLIDDAKEPFTQFGILNPEMFK